MADYLLNPHTVTSKRWSSLRLVILWLGVCAALMVISTRLAYLQTELEDAFVDHSDYQPYAVEPVSAIDGRILSSDGQVLAYDHQTFRLNISYRWLQDPPDPRWMKKQIRAILTAEERKDPALVERTTEDILARRDQLWRDLALLSGLRHEDLLAKRLRIQTRVEKLKDNVRKKRTEREDKPAPETPAHADVELASASITDQLQSQIETLVHTVKSELTRAPKRSDSDEDLVLKEELSSHLLLPNISREAVLQIEAYPHRFPGVSVDVSTRRIYPLGAEAAHLIGYQRKSIDDWGVITATRNRGVEQSRARQLAGQSGERQIDLKTGEAKILKEAISGQDVTMTLNSQLQQSLEQALDQIVTPVDQMMFAVPDPEKPEPTGASITVMNVHTGEIIAAASAPRPNLSLLADGDSEYWELLKNDQRSPLLCRPFQAQLTPGSTFKIVTSLGLVNSGRWDPMREMECQGYLDNPNKFRCFIYKHYNVGHGPTNLDSALARSCNVYFFTAARQLGPDPIVNAAELLGLGRPTGLDLAGEKAGYVPSPSQYRQQNQMWFPGESLGLAIGQSTLQVTPLQMTRLVAAIANGGNLVHPHVVRDPESIQSQSLGIPPRTLSIIRHGLVSVVEDPHGTGYKTVRHPAIKIAGKTGTAETGAKGDHAWFTGYVPADNPQYAFTVVLEHAGSGSSIAGPLAKELVQKMLDLRIVAADLPPQVAGE